MQATYQRMDQSMFKKRISIRDMEALIRLGASIGKTVFFYGGAGLGKSEKVRQIADSMFPSRVGNNLCDVRLSDKEPQDVAGIPIPVTLIDEKTGKEVTRTVYAVPNFWPTDPDWQGIVFLDELPNAPLGTQHSAYQVILDHVAGEHKFPEGCVFVGAGNRDTDGAGTTTMPGPLVNRMILAEIDYNLDVWIEDYAIPYRLHPNVIGFLKQFPEHFYTGDVENRSTQVFASPRQWKTVSDILYKYDQGTMSEFIAEVAIAGTVGEGLEVQVLAYHMRTKELPAIEDIFSGKVKEHKLDRSKNDLVYVLAQTGLRKMEDEVMDNEIKDEDFLERSGNFLTFMYNNYYDNNKDTLIAMILGVFRGPNDKPSILTVNPRRQKMIPMMRKTCPTISAVVMEYMTRYGQLIKDFE
jgi:hypothetical protein